MRFLVTGGAGFIGSHLVDRLIEMGYEVVVVDNLLTGSEKNLNKKAIFYNLDITDLEKLEKVFNSHKPDYVFHVAAGYLVQSLDNPQRDAKINIIGSINVCEMCVKYKVKKLIYSNSGGASYGDPLEIPIKETHQIKPLTPYGISKHTAEHYLEMYHLNFGLKYTSLRYANIYGPRQDPRLEGGIVVIFTDKILNGKEPTIFGDGSHYRDYCYVGDVVNANIWAIDSGDNDSFNIGTGQGTTNQEIFEIIRDLLKSNLKVNHGPERRGDTKGCVLDISKIKSLGWEPEYDLRQGITELINYLRNVEK